MSNPITVPKGARKTNCAPSNSDLSPAYRGLLESIRQVNFGRIEGLVVRGGEPVLDPPPRVVGAIRLAQRGPSRPESAGAQCHWKREQFALVQELAAIGTGVIRTIKVHDGLPVALEIHETAKIPDTSRSESVG